MRALWFVALLVAVVVGKQLCLEGEAPLAIGPGSPDRLWCTEDDCTLKWALTVDTATVDDQRWALEATVNGTSLSHLFPQLTDVRIQCSTSGEVIATTSSGPNAERLRLIWTYSGVSSVSCSYVLTTADLQSDFRNFEALLAYSGHISSFDATFSSQDAHYSIASREQVCPASQPEDGGAATAGTHTPPPETCSIGACRHSPATWRSMQDHPAWLVIGADRFCSLSCHDIIFGKGQARYMPVHWMEESVQLCAAKLNAAMYGCALPLDTNEALANSNEYLTNLLKCSLNANRDTIVRSVANWNSQEIKCDLEAGDNAGSGQGQNVHAKGTSTEESYLIWAIVMTVAFVILCVVMAGILLSFAGPIRSYLMGTARSLTQGVSSERVGGEMEMTAMPSSSSFLASFFASDEGAEEDTGEVAPRPTMIARRTQPMAPPVYGSAQGFAGASAPLMAGPEQMTVPTLAQQYAPAPSFGAYASPTYSTTPASYYMSSAGAAPGATTAAPAVAQGFTLSSYAQGDTTGLQ